MVLLEEDEVKTQFCKEEVREESEASSSIYYFSKHLTFSQLLKLKKKVIPPKYFHGPWGQAIADVDESRASSTEETTAGSREIVSDFPWLYRLTVNRETPPTHFIGSEP